MRVLVTGANGFVGAALCRRLPALGFEVHALVRKGRAAARLAALGVVHEGDLGDPNTIAAAAADCELMFHCAGESAYHASQEALAWINVAGTENAVLAARHAGVRRVVLLSCADVSLCNRDRIHWKENALLGQAPLGAFARSKLLAEELALQASNAKTTVTALRPAWLWGAHDHTNLPALCLEAQHGGIQLFGRGHNLFATTHVDNLVDALIAAAQMPNVGGRAFHVADTEVLSAREFFGKLCAAIGSPLLRSGIYSISYALGWLRRSQRLAGPWPEDVARRGRGYLPDCLHAIKTLDYKPRVSVDQGMLELAAWARAAGGPEAIAKLARVPASADDIARHKQLASELG